MRCIEHRFFIITYIFHWLYLPLLVVYLGRVRVYVSGVVGCVSHRHGYDCDDACDGDDVGYVVADVGIRHAVACYEDIRLN